MESCGQSHWTYCKEIPAQICSKDLKLSQSAGPKDTFLKTSSKNPIETFSQLWAQLPHWLLFTLDSDLSTFLFICDTEKWICHANLKDEKWWREGLKVNSSVRRCESQLVRGSIAWRQSVFCLQTNKKSQSSCLVKEIRLQTFLPVEVVVLDVCNAAFCS